MGEQCSQHARALLQPRGATVREGSVAGQPTVADRLPHVLELSSGHVRAVEHESFHAWKTNLLRIGRQPFDLQNAFRHADYSSIAVREKLVLEDRESEAGRAERVA